MRKTRKNATVTSTAFVFSQALGELAVRPDAPERSAATEPDPLDDCFFEATGG